MLIVLVWAIVAVAVVVRLGVVLSARAAGRRERPGTPGATRREGLAYLPDPAQYQGWTDPGPAAEGHQAHHHGHHHGGHQEWGGGGHHSGHHDSGSSWSASAGSSDFGGGHHHG